MRLRSVRGSVALAACLLLASPVAAQASASSIAPEGLPVAVGAAEVDADAVLRAELFALAQTQTREEARAIAEMEYTEALVDDNGEILAARRISPLVQMRVHHLSPGCSVTSACLHGNNGNSRVGFAGLGTLRTTVSSVTRFASGNATTTLWSGGLHWAIGPNRTFVLAEARTIDTVVRS